MLMQHVNQKLTQLPHLRYQTNMVSRKLNSMKLSPTIEISKRKPTGKTSTFTMFPGNSTPWKLPNNGDLKEETNREGESASRKLSSNLQLCPSSPSHPQNSPSYAQPLAEDPEQMFMENMENWCNLQQEGLCGTQRFPKCRRSFSFSPSCKGFVQSHL